MNAKNIVNLFLISCSVFFAGISLSLLSPFYPTEALSKGVSVTQSGLVLGSVFITTIIFTPIVGKYIDILGARKFLIIGCFIVGVGNVSFGFLADVNNTNTFFALSIVIRVITAIGEAAVAPASYPLASKQVSKENSGKAIAAAEACFGVGTMFGPSLGGILYDLGGFPLPFWISGGLAIVTSILSLLLLKDDSTQYDNLEDTKKVSWWEILKAPGVLISVFALAFSGSAWAWYSASLEPWLKEEFGLSSSSTGLVLMTFGLVYTIFTPLCGFLADRGMDGLIAMTVGNLVISVGFVFLGPIPPFQAIGGQLWLVVVSLGLQGLGSAATYLGALLYMMKSCINSGLPDNEQTNGMVSSLWVVSDCIGGYLGTTLGSIAFDNIGFEAGTMAEAGALALTVLVLCVYLPVNHFCWGKQNRRELETSGDSQAENERSRLVKEIEKEGRIYGS